MTDNCMLHDIFKDDNTQTTEIVAQILIMNKRMDSSKEKRTAKKNTNDDGQLLTNQEKKLLKAQTFVDHVERSRMQRYENQRQEKCCIKLLSYARHISAVTLRLMFFAINLIMLYYCIMNLD